MAAIDISSTAVPLSNGILQLQNGVAMDSTLRNVADQNNITSPLKLSTNLVQVNSTIFGSGTQTTSNFVIQKESSNDLIFYSPSTWGGLLTPPTTGNSNTMLNGSLTGTHGGFGNVAVGLGTIQADGSAYNFNVAIGQAAFVRGRFSTAIGQGATIGSVSTIGDFATAIGYNAVANGNNCFALGDSTAKLQIGGNFVPTARIHAKGLGATSATTALLIENSASNSALTIKDDLTSTFGGSVSVGATIVASAILQADSTTKGFLPPRMTTAEINAIATPAEGLVAFNTTISHLCCYQSGAWVKFNHSPM